MQKLLNLFNEQGTVDEMGLRMIRDAFSAELFPGITSLQTHLRYVLFVPWIYKRLDTRPVDEANLHDSLRRAEVELIKPLAQTEAKGVIGINAGASLQRRPSSIYWNCLRRWGIFQYPNSQGWYHSQRLRKTDRAHARSNDFDDPTGNGPLWHPRLPEAAPDFPRSVSFALRNEEALFIQEQISTHCSGSLLAFLAIHPQETLDGSFWDLPVIETANMSLKETVELARRFSLFVESMPLMYNLMLAEQQDDLAEIRDAAAARVEEYQHRLDDWIRRERAEEHSFSPSDLWIFLAEVRCQVKHPTKKFMNDWAHRLADIGISNISTDREIRDLVEKRERRLKGASTRSSQQPRSYSGLAGWLWSWATRFQLVSRERVAIGTISRTTRLLAYDNRAVALELLRPPSRARLDFAVVLSYTLNLEALLALPLAVVSHQEAGIDELLQDPIRLLQSLREVGDRIHVFVDEAGVHVPQRRHPVFVALEDSVHLVRAPNGGVFHPKLWVARFVQSDGTACIRAAILSRNLTFDRSLDLALVSEAIPGEETISGSEPIRYLLEAMGPMSSLPLSKKLSTQLNELGEQISRCAFLPPQGFHLNPIDFQPIGIPGYSRWNPKIENGKRVLAVAPFVNGSTLEVLQGLGPHQSRLISLPEELNSIKPEILDKWSSVNVLDDDLNEQDEEMDDDESEEKHSSTLAGLHAKFVVVEHPRNQVAWTLGSANLTAAAHSGHNVELIAHLSGRANHVGIDQVWKEIERFCQDYKRPQDATEVSDEEREAKDLLSQAKRSFLDSQTLRVICKPERAGTLWVWTLEGDFTIDTRVQIHAWPISVNQDQCKELLLPVSWKSMKEERLISFVAFRLSVKGFSDLDESFVLNLPISGVSKERVDKVLSSVIDSTEKLLLFLRLLLGENHDDWLVPTADGTQRHDVFDHAGFAMETLLEDLLRITSRNPKRLEPFQKLMSNLKKTPEGRALIPKDLEELWKAVEQALAK